MDSLLAVSRFPAGGIFLRDTPGRRLPDPDGQVFAGIQLRKIQGKFQKKVSDPAALLPGEITAEVYTYIIR